jgi:hypothetical protein
MAKRKNAKNWLRMALKCGLLATDTSVWEAMHHLMEEGSGTMQSAFDRADKLGEKRDGGKSSWSHASTLLVGVGIGVGLGILIAPVSGEEARDAIRDTASNVRTKVGDVAAWAGRKNSSAGKDYAIYAN